MHSYVFYDKATDGKILQHWGRTVRTQGKSPKVNGVLQIRPNSLDFDSWNNQFGRCTGYQDDVWKDTTYGIFAGTLPTSYKSKLVQDVLLDARIRAGNAFFEEAGGVRVNLFDLYRTRIESAEMVVKNMRKLGMAYTYLKKGRWRQFCSTLGISAKKPKKNKDNIPALWLEYSYGWAPLISDCYTILEETFKVPEMFIRKVFRQENPYFGEQGDNYSMQTLSGTIQARGVATGYVTIDAPALAALSQYGITNPTAVMWEAVPFSFVVDWFAPVGDFLNSLGALNGLKFKDYSVTSQVKVNLDGIGKRKTLSSHSWKTQSRSGSVKYHFKVKNRMVAPGPEWIYVNSNPMDQSVTRWSYALSLLASIFGSSSKK